MNIFTKKKEEITMNNLYDKTIKNRKESIKIVIDDIKRLIEEKTYSGKFYLVLKIDKDIVYDVIEYFKSEGLNVKYNLDGNVIFSWKKESSLKELVMELMCEIKSIYINYLKKMKRRFRR